MKKRNLLFASLLACAGLEAQNAAVFENYRYDAVDRFAAQTAKNQYQNPILAGFMPDPSICRKGDDYYLVNSTFSYFPGVPIWHSKDLVHWTQLGSVLNRESQLRLGRSSMSGGVYAPDIKYNPHNNLFYMITTGTGYGAVSIVTTDDPKKRNWSDPIVVSNMGGIDPSLFFDDDGKAYIVNNDAPAGQAEYDGHRAIWVREFDWKTNKTVGEPKVAVDKGVVPADKPIWIEGPHLYKINGTYYLMCAEGGTEVRHSEVVFTSKSPMGPFTPCAVNPILTQRDLPDGRLNPVTSSGHADLVQTAAGDWYAVFLACRPYGDNLYNTGRETFLLPVSWKNGQPIILPAGKEIPYAVNKSAEMLSLEKKYPSTGFDFYHPGPLWTAGGLKDHALFVRNPSGNFYSILPSGALSLRLKDVSMNERANPAFICQRVTSWYFTASVNLNFQPATATEFAGMACFQNESHFIQFGKTLDTLTGKPILLVEAFKGGRSVYRASTPLLEKNAAASLTLQVKAEKPDLYAFSYSADGGKSWKRVGEPVDATLLSTKVASGFQGAAVGVYATAKRRL
jgi:beta-xylosidase